MRIEVNGFGGLSTGPSPSNYLTWSQFVAEAGNIEIGAISIDLDGGFTGTQQMDVANFQINNQIFNPSVPEPGSLSRFTVALICLGSVVLGRGRQTA